MHGAALATTDASLLAKELGHDLPRWHILAKGMNVVSVCGADKVV